MADVGTPVGVCCVVVRGVRGVGFEPTLALSRATEREMPGESPLRHPPDIHRVQLIRRTRRNGCKCNGRRSATCQSQKNGGRGGRVVEREREGARAESFIAKCARRNFSPTPAPLTDNVLRIGRF
jgi:hypothetical protein